MDGRWGRSFPYQERRAGWGGGGDVMLEEPGGLACSKSDN